MKTLQTISMIAGMAMVAGVIIWIAWMRFIKKELVFGERARKIAVVVVAAALTLFTLGVRTEIWGRVIGLVVAATMLFSVLYKPKPKAAKAKAKAGAGQSRPTYRLDDLRRPKKKKRHKR